MAQTSFIIPNLIQGVSQQPDAQRDPSQGELQINGVSSIAEGLKKRNGTRPLARVSSSLFGNAFVHEILRDASEKYLAVVTSTGIRVFDLSGVERTVSAPGGFSYLSTITDARTQIRCSTIADFTFISSLKRTPAMKAALSPATARPSANEALIWFRAATYGNSYRVFCNGQQVSYTAPIQPVTAVGSNIIENRLTTETLAAKVRAAFLFGAATALTTTGSATTLNGTRTAQVATTSGDGEGLTVTVTGNGAAITACTIAAGGVGHQAGAQVFVARYQLEGGTDVTPVQVATISAAAAGPLAGVTITRSGSILWLQSASPITLLATDGRNNSDVSAILATVQAFSDLPRVAPQGYQVAISGDNTNRFDGYYVSFQCRSGTFGEGQWLEAVAPGIPYQLEETLMPHVLVRLPNGTFHFGPANGSTVSTVTLPTWGQRAAGDLTTAPDPGFIGRPIQDLIVYKNRLCVLADERIILSRAKNLFAFFPETVTTILDSDPIDLTASNNRVSILRYAVPYQDELIVFSDQLQFRFNSSGSALAPSTAQITVLTNYEIDPNVRPIPMAGAIVFAQVNGDWAQFREFSVRGAGTALVANADDLTAYVSSYVPAGVFKLSNNEAGNEWFAITSGQPKRIYCYRFFYRNQSGNTERVQSSWSYWELSGVDAILQSSVVLETLYLLVTRGSDVWLESIDIAGRRPDPGAPYQLLLDRRVSTGTDTPAALRPALGTYNAATRQTTWTLPFTIRSKTECWTTFANDANSAVKLAEASSGTTLTADGNWSTAQVFIGETFAFRYRFTRFKAMRDVGGGKAAINQARTQVRHAKIRFHETGFFKAVVTLDRRAPATYTYSGSILGANNSVVGYSPPGSLALSAQAGVFRIPILSRGERAMVELQNDTPLPCKFSTVEWVGEVSSLAGGKA